MKKGITKEQAIDVALELMKDKEDIRNVNLREIARSIGCAHTNLYNYFKSLDDLLWEAHMEILRRFSWNLEKHLVTIDDNEKKLDCFFNEFLDFALNNRGWFRLAWVEVIRGERPKIDEAITSGTVDNLVEIIENIWVELYGEGCEKNKIRNALHIVHSYIHGELSIYIAQRSLLSDKKEFKAYVINVSKTMIRLLLKKEE